MYFVVTGTPYMGMIGFNIYIMGPMGQMQTIHLHVSKWDFPLLFHRSPNPDQPSHKSLVSGYQDCAGLTNLTLLQKRDPEDTDPFIGKSYVPCLSGIPEGQRYGH